MEVVPPVARLMGSAEGFGKGVPALEDEIYGDNVSLRAFRNKIPDSRLLAETRQPSIIRNDVPNDRGMGSKNYHSLTLNIDTRFNEQKCSRLVKSNSELAKRHGMVNSEFSKSKAGVLGVNGVTPETSSSPASDIFSERTQLMKQRSTAVCRRVEKRNIKPNKNKCDSFSLKNGLVEFSTASGGNNYLGLRRLKPDSFDTTKHIDEVSLDELLSGSYKCPSISLQKAKKTASSTDNLLESFRKVCSVLEDKKMLKPQSCVGIDNSYIENAQAGLVTSPSAADQSQIDNKDTYVSDIPSSEKVKESKEGIRMPNVADLTLHQPKDILEHLVLPPPKDLDSLLYNGGKTTPSKNCTDNHPGTPVSQRTGLPPFSWSQSASGNSKLGGVDASKLSSNRTICLGKWLKLEKSIALQKGREDFLADFESLTFDQSLVPSLTAVPKGMTSDSAPMELVLPASVTWSASKDPTDDEQSPTHVAARMLLGMAKDLHQNPLETIKLLKRPAHFASKAAKSKPMERSVRFFDPPRSIKLVDPLELGDSGFPSKKVKLSTNKGGFIHHGGPERKGPLSWYGSSSSTSSLRSTVKLFKHSTSARDSDGTNVAMKPFLMKPPKPGESPRLSSLHNKLWKSTK